MEGNKTFFICPVCFRVCESEQECHQHRTVACNAKEEGAACRRPLQDRFGQFVSRAPRWYLEAQGRIPAWTPLKSQKSQRRP